MDISKIIGVGIGSLAVAAVGFAKSAFGLDVDAGKVVENANTYVADNIKAQKVSDKADDDTATNGLD